MLKDLRRFEEQAKLALVSAVASIVFMIGGAGLAARNYESDLHQIVYREAGWLAAFVGCVGASMLLGGGACALGLNSAGQRRNHRSAWSWTGFLLGGFVLGMDVILLVAFWMLRFQVPPAAP